MHSKNIFFKGWILILILSLVLSFSGCSSANKYNPKLVTQSIDKHSPEFILREYLDFRQIAKPVPALTPISPFIEFMFQEDQIDMYDRVYNIMLFESEIPTRKDFAQHFLAPLVNYSILQTIDENNDKVIITVSETKYGDMFFNELFGLSPADQLELFSMTEKERNQALRVVHEKLVDEFDSNYNNAKKTATYEDEVTYTLKRIDEGFIIVWDEISSLRDKEAIMEFQQKWAEKEDKIIKAIFSLEIAQIEVKQYNKNVFIEGVVRNAGEEDIPDFSFITIEIELLDIDGKPIAADKDYIFELESNLSDRFSVMFSEYQIINWEGSYRVRIGDMSIDFVTDWTIYNK